MEIVVGDGAFDVDPDVLNNGLARCLKSKAVAACSFEWFSEQTIRVRSPSAERSV